MRSWSKVPDVMTDVGVVGKVCIQYRDPITNKVKEEIKGTNHAFKDTIFCKEWMTRFSSAPMVITDRRDPVDPNFPFMRGRVIGWGLWGQSGTGSYQGRYLAADSYQYLWQGGKIASKATFEFTPTQALGHLGQIGLTRQFPAYLTTSADIRFKEYRIRSDFYGSGASDIRMNKGENIYSLSNSHVYSFRGLLLGTESPPSSYSISSRNDEGRNPAYTRIACSIDSDKMYICLAFNATSSDPEKIVFYEYPDDTFPVDGRLGKYEFTADMFDSNYYRGTQYLGHGVARGRKIYTIYSASSGYYLLIFDLENMTAEFGERISDYALPNRTSFIHTSDVTILDYKHVIFGWIRTNGHYQVIVDLEAEEAVASLGIYESYLMIIKDLFGNGITLVHAGASSGGSGQMFHSPQALGIYKVPDDTPERPEGYGLTISYEIEVEY